MARRGKWDGGHSPLTVVGVIALAVVVLGFAGYVVARDPAPPSSAVTIDDVPEVAEPVSVSVLSDSHAYNADSWFRLTVEDGKVPGAKLGVFVSFPGKGVETIRAGLPRIDGSDVVIVQAGTNDLLSGRPAAEVAGDVEQLVTDAQARVDTVALALEPPSDQKPDGAKALASLLTEWAGQHDVPLIDVYTPVAAEDGSWRDGLSLDGTHANAAGSRLMAKAALPALRDLVSG